MKIHELDGQHICLVGYGREGQAMHRALRTFAPLARIAIADANPELRVEDAELQTGPDYLEQLDRFDVVVKTPGIKHTPQLDNLGDKLTSATRILFDTIDGSGVTVVGVTGSKGKSTTTTLIYHALKAHNPRTFLMGNIGIPMIDFLPEAQADTNFVIELSNYQLEDMTRSPHIAVMTSFFAEHLDYHGSVEAYFAAKRHIAEFQDADDVIFYNDASADCRKLAQASQGQKIPFLADDFPLPIAQTKLKGEHNRSNLAAAYKVALFCGVPEAVALKALAETEGLPYRLHSLGVHDGIEWVDDSLSTAPEATMFGLEALGDKVDTLITGGMNRGLDFTALGKYISASKIRNLVLFPDSGTAIRQALTRDVQILETSSMEEAVAFAKEHTKKQAIALLSSASPSYNLFKNYEDKSAQFTAAIGLAGDRTA